MPTSGIERNQELKDFAVYVDARSIGQRIEDWLFKQENMRNVQLALAALCLVLPMLTVFVFPFAALLYLWWRIKVRYFRLPVRYPAWTKHPDPSNIDDKKGLSPAEGIEFLGVERLGRTVDESYEVWVSDSDVRTHRVIMGTTGAGKTQKLLSILFNPLCWGSGFSFTDGKAQIDVTADVFVMARLFWREDDVLVLNYMRGGQDRFKEMVKKPKVGVRKNRVSNTWNPFATANHETINQIIDSIMEKATGDSAQWQAKAINMKNALVQTIAYLRAKGDMLMSVSTIREQMALDNIIKLAMRTDIPPAAAAAIRSYLSTGLPGFSWARAKQGRPQDQETLLQHGYLTGQFTRTLGLMTDTYFDIFGDEIPEFDTSDVILNNRLSVTMIPTLEKGVEEAGNLGKMQVASAKMMMAENLGYELEGRYVDVVENRPTNTNRPFYYVMDELGYYFAPGIDLMFAQGRSLQVALIAAGQDFQAMAKNHKNEVESMIANTRIKEAMKLEDPKETYEIFQKAAGKSIVARLSGFETQNPGAALPFFNYKHSENITIEEADRVSLQELKRLAPGDSVMLYGDKVIRLRSFNLFMQYKFDKRKVDIRINTFLPIAQPDITQIADKCRPARTNEESPGARIMALLRGGEIMWTAEAERVAASPVFAALLDAAGKIERRPNLSPQDKGIILFMAAVEAMEKTAPEALVPAAPVEDVEDDASGEGPDGPEPDEAVKALLARKRQDLSYLNEPPIQEVLDAQTSDADDAGTGDEDLTFGEGVFFGEEAIQDGQADAATSARIDFTPPTKETMAAIMTGLAGGKDAITQETVADEIEKTRRVVDAACRYQDTDADLEAHADETQTQAAVLDLLKSLDRLQEDLSGRK